LGSVTENIAVRGKLSSSHPRKDHRGVDLISDALPFGRLWYAEPNAVSNAIGYSVHCSQSHDTVIRVYDVAGNVIETREHKGEFNESVNPYGLASQRKRTQKLLLEFGIRCANIHASKDFVRSNKTKSDAVRIPLSGEV
jgi:hypothetical protein